MTKLLLQAVPMFYLCKLDGVVVSFNVQNLRCPLNCRLSRAHQYWLNQYGTWICQQQPHLLIFSTINSCFIEDFVIGFRYLMAAGGLRGKRSLRSIELFDPKKPDKENT